MLSWALIFFVVAIVAAIFGFGGIASASAGIARFCSSFSSFSSLSPSSQAWPEETETGRAPVSGAGSSRRCVSGFALTNRR